MGNASTADGVVWTQRFRSGTEVSFNHASATGRVRWGALLRRFIASSMHLSSIFPLYLINSLRAYLLTSSILFTGGRGRVVMQ